MFLGRPLTWRGLVINLAVVLLLPVVLVLLAEPSLELLGAWARIIIPFAAAWGLWTYVVYRHTPKPPPQPPVPTECPACDYPLQRDWKCCPECGRPTRPPETVKRIVVKAFEKPKA